MATSADLCWDAWLAYNFALRNPDSQESAREAGAALYDQARHADMFARGDAQNDILDRLKKETEA